MATHHEQPIFVNLKSNTYEKNTLQRYGLLTNSQIMKPFRAII